MKRRSLLIAVLLLPVLMAAVVSAGTGADPTVIAQRGVVKPGEPAPNFQLRDMNGRIVALSDLRGKVVLLNVWATWCGPCRVEMPAIQALHEAYGPHGLKVVAASIDDPGAEDGIRDFAREYGLAFEILHDAPGAIQRAYQTTGVPETFVIGADRVIRKKVIGAADWNSTSNRALVAQL